MNNRERRIVQRHGRYLPPRRPVAGIGISLGNTARWNKRKARRYDLVLLHVYEWLKYWFWIEPYR